MNVNLLDTVILQKDFPEYGLKYGDIGAVVELYGTAAMEVEFVTTTGETQALLTLEDNDIRLAKPDEIPTARLLDAA